MPAAPMRTVDEPGMGRLDIFPLPVDEASLMALIVDVFEKDWPRIQFGVLIQGAAWEVRAPGPPRRISLLDGYVTVDFGVWHFHLCIGPTTGVGAAPTPPDLARHRRTARAELYRILNVETGAPQSWGLRLYNGRDEQQMTVFLPNPFLTEHGKMQRPPDWSRLAAWDRLRKTFLGLDPDPADRRGTGFKHS
jgi:hypothetical protein